MRTLPSCCCPVGNIMVFEQWKLEVRYPTDDGTYSYGKLRERKMRNLLDNAYLTIHLDDGSLAFTGKNLPPRLGIHM